MLPFRHRSRQSDPSNERLEAAIRDLGEAGNEVTRIAVTAGEESAEVLGDAIDELRQSAVRVSKAALVAGSRQLDTVADRLSELARELEPERKHWWQRQ
jgi:replicative DNA helicase